MTRKNTDLVSPLQVDDITILLNDVKLDSIEQGSLELRHMFKT